MKDVNKQIDKVSITKEHRALVKFRDFPNLDEHAKDITARNCYNPTLYRHNEYWIVAWINHVGISILKFEDKDICNAIDKAYDWLQSNIFKNNTNEVKIEDINNY